MQSLLLKLQADVAARKRPRSELWPTLRIMGLMAVMLALVFELGARSVDTSAGWASRAANKDRLLEMNALLDAKQGEIDLQKAYIQRLERIQAKSARYGIGADLASAIEDIALSEDVDPEIAFELVRVESEFTQRAVSPVGAVGLTQLMPATARLLSPGITRKEMFDRETNLRLGFSFFRSLIDYYDGDIRLALLAYNRGPGTVDRLLASGQDPANGYATMILGEQ
ncbi:MAG TPA: transglycosylase SLT domain-containing protein [Longimicrobiaceae bacterium]|nr:transglycosylase SLT domain-containing protein [Longimicrobiaceae bacterium]